jgi:type II secretion system protein H
MVIARSIRLLSIAEPQANRFASGSPFFERRGFSLIELLIVLAILTIAAAFVLPSMTGPLDRSRLRSGAVDMQNAWGKARTLAIREGMEMAFRCEIGGQKWKIERVQQTQTPDVSPDPFQLASVEESPTTESEVMRQGRLADGLTFDDLKFRTQPTVAETGPNLDSEVADFSLQPEQSVRRWSEPLLFQPDGRSEDVRLRITGADDFVVHVRMRGLTAGVSFTSPFRRKSDTQEVEEQL